MYFLIYFILWNKIKLIYFAQKKFFINFYHFLKFLNFIKFLNVLKIVNINFEF